jgi:RNA binding exosome subunit
MSMVNFASADIEIMIHATEDSTKVLSAVNELFQIEPEEFVANGVKGHFGNDIVRFKANLSSKRATDIAYKIINMMNDEDRLSMHDNFDLFTDGKNSIYLRISKQKIFERKVVLEQADSLKIKLKIVRRFQPKNEIERYRKMLVRGDDY